jgi:5-methylthioadenosine/S-adenosylhomocysteine deaminase
MTSFIVAADRIVTVNDANDVLLDHAIRIEEGVIVAIGPREEVIAHSPELPVFSRSESLLMPGMINAHTHLAMTLLRGWAEGVDLQGFLERVWAAEALLMDPQIVADGTELGAVECLLGGTTTTLDMYLLPDAAHRGAVSAGLRHVGGPIFFDFKGLDGFEWSERIEAARAWPAQLKAIGGPQIPVVLAPHATYTVSPEHLSELAALAEELDAMVTIHASENEAENLDVQSRYDLSPVQVLQQSGLLSRRIVLGHGVHLSDTDLALLNNGQSAVAHCPGSNLKLNSGLAKFHHMRSSGVTVPLGTDGCSSSNDLNMWFVMRLAALVATTVMEAPEKVSAVDFVRAATIDGAVALGMQDLIGSIEVGKQADFILMDTSAPHLTPIHDVHALLVFAAGREDVTDVWVDGRHLVKDRQMTSTDVPALRSRITSHLARLA